MIIKCHDLAFSFRRLVAPFYIFCELLNKLSIFVRDALCRA